MGMHRTPAAQCSVDLFDILNKEGPLHSMPSKEELSFYIYWSKLLLVPLQHIKGSGKLDPNENGVKKKGFSGELAIFFVFILPAVGEFQTLGLLFSQTLAFRIIVTNTWKWSNTFGTVVEGTALPTGQFGPQNLRWPKGTQFTVDKYACDNPINCRYVWSAVCTIKMHC